MAIVAIEGNVFWGIDDTDDKLHIVKIAGNGVEDVKEVDFS